MVKKVYVAGHNGMVGSAIVRALKERSSEKELQIEVASRAELDLLDQSKTSEYFKDHQFDEVYMSAAKVGGIYANSTFPADFIYENLAVQNNIIRSAWETKVSKLLFLGSSCIYPKLAEQPIKEETLLSGSLEPTNSAYAIAKIAGLQMCKNYNQQYGTDFRAVMPTNLYGPNDNFHEKDSHVLPALMQRINEAKELNKNEVIIWGSGNPKREFMHVNDMAEGCIHVMGLSKNQYFERVLPEYQYLNVGTGMDVSIKELSLLIAEIVGFTGTLVFDKSKPDGTPRKLLDVSRINEAGWTAKVELAEGIKDTYNWYLANTAKLRR